MSGLVLLLVLAWVKVSDKLHSHRKAYAVGNEGMGLFVRALSYCADQLTDGFVPGAWVSSLASDKLAAALTDAGLWRPVDGGFQIDSYLECNPSRADAEAKREAQRQGGKRGAQRRWRDRPTDGLTQETPDGRTDSGTQPATHDDLHGPVPGTRTRRKNPAPAPAPSTADRGTGAGAGSATADDDLDLDALRIGAEPLETDANGRRRADTSDAATRARTRGAR